MKYYSGLDVSPKETFISIVDEKGKIVKEEVVVSESKAIAEYLLSPRSEWTALKSSQYSGYTTITHPFHPRKGQRFQILSTKNFKNRDIYRLRH